MLLTKIIMNRVLTNATNGIDGVVFRVDNGGAPANVEYRMIGPGELLSDDFHLAALALVERDEGWEDFKITYLNSLATSEIELRRAMKLLHERGGWK
jgi:hypothetical protein